MRILVDHGTHANFGDLAMVESVVVRLRHVAPQAELCVVDRSPLLEPLWRRPGVVPAPPYRVRVWGETTVRHLPWLWRRADAWARVSGRLMLVAGGLGYPAGMFGTTLPQGTAHLAEYCRSFDALHVVGGGNLTDAFFFELLNRTCLIRACAAGGRPVVLTGQQLGPFDAWASRRGLGGALRRATLVGLRDAGTSLTFCRNAGIDPSKLVTTGDDALGLDPVNPAAARAWMVAAGIDVPEFLAINFREGAYVGGIPDRAERFAGLVDALHDTFGLPAVVVPVSVGNHDHDLDAGRRLLPLVRRARVIVPRIPPAAVDDVRGCLAASRVAVGVSHHFCTFALAAGVPTVCVFDGAYYRQKAEALARAWDDERLAAPLSAPSAETAAAVAQIDADPVVRGRLMDRAAQSRAAWRQVFDERVGAAFAGCRP